MRCGIWTSPAGRGTTAGRSPRIPATASRPIRTCSVGDFFRFADFAGMPGTIGVPGGSPATFSQRSQARDHHQRIWLGAVGSRGQRHHTGHGQVLRESPRAEHDGRRSAASIARGPWPPRPSSGGLIGRWRACSISAAWPIPSRKAVTSDHFRRHRKADLEPAFQKYVGDAFAPVGLMIDFWAAICPRGGPARFRSS